MANESVTEAPQRTKKTDFDFIPVDSADLLSVNAGLSAFAAVHRAQLLENFVSKRLFEAVIDEGMDADTADHLHFSLRLARALRVAAGQEA